MIRNQRGVAVVMALGVVALAAIAVSAMLTTQGIWVRERQLEADHAQAHILIQSGVDWARAVLSDDRRLTNVDHAGEPWALRLPPMPVDNGELAGYLEDQQGMFNLNNLVQGGKVNEVQLERFRRLLSLLGLPVALAASLSDWMDTDSDPLPAGGAEDDYYLSLPFPRLAANRPLTDVAELSLVRGFDEDVRARLAPFVTALPGATPINANTATPEVLSAVIDGLDLDSARSLAALRERTYFRDYADFVARLPRGVSAPADAFRANSNYFVAHVRVTIGAAEARGEALLARNDAGWPAIVWRKYE